MDMEGFPPFVMKRYMWMGEGDKKHNFQRYKTIK